MKTSIVCAALVMGFGLMAGKASAQDAQRFGYGYPGERFVCESNDGRYRECRFSGGDVRLARQLSRSQCREGETWGRRGNAVWVNGGCRAEFQLAGWGRHDRDDDDDDRDYRRRGNRDGYGYGGRYDDNYDRRNWNSRVVCESHGSRHNRCRIDTRRGVSLVRQLSGTRCREGHNWGIGNGEVWVDHGCRGEFVSGGNRGWGSDGYYDRGYSGGAGSIVQCGSTDGRQNYCRANVHRGVGLVRQISRSACIEGRTWGWNRSGVWVSNGCRAEFRVW